jgi:hypothetical protein
LNTYGYVGGNPVRLIDPPGLWSTEAHNFFVDTYFSNMNSIDLQNIKNGSKYADSAQFQFGNSAHMHAMGDGVNSSQEQCRKMNNYIHQKMDEYRSMLSASSSANNPLLSRAKRARAYHSLGMALHAAMDYTSPAHKGWQVWQWNKETVKRHGDFSKSLEDIWAAQDPNSFMDTLNSMSSVMNGNALGCGCN